MQPRSSSVAPVFLAVLASACGAPAPTARVAPAGPRFELSAGDVLSGDDVQIALRGFAPGSEVEVVAERPVRQYVGPAPTRKLYRPHARFRASADGSLSLATAAPLAGTYEGADLRGLFWSMTPTEDPIAEGWTDEQVQLVASYRGAVAARATLTLHDHTPALEVTPVGAALPGAVLARLPGAQRRPAIIVLGGSEGFDWTARALAPRLASHGYAVLGLPYYAPVYPGLSRPDLATPGRAPRRGAPGAHPGGALSRRRARRRRERRPLVGTAALK